MKSAALGLTLTLLLAGNAGAVLPNEQLADAKLEARARAIGGDLRCVVCQNQTIDDSDADLARDLRIILRERLVAGDSDRQAINYIVARYGDFVLLKPPLNTATWLLWFGPALTLLAGGAGVAAYLRGRGEDLGHAASLTASEQARVTELLNQDRAL